jgi:hypothetical protein
MISLSTRAVPCNNTRVARMIPVVLPRMTTSCAMMTPLTAAPFAHNQLYAADIATGGHRSEFHHPYANG